MFFVKENRKRLARRFPDSTFGELGREMGLAWRELKPAQKKKYEAMHVVDQRRYQREKSKYEKTSLDKAFRRMRVQDD
jgi:hypothetical protein